MRTGRLEESRATLEKAVQARPDDPYNLQRIARFMVHPDGPACRWDPASAVDLAREAVRLSPRIDAFLVDTLAYALYMNGQIQQAIERGESAVKNLGAFSTKPDGAGGQRELLFESSALGELCTRLFR